MSVIGGLQRVSKPTSSQDSQAVTVQATAHQPPQPVAAPWRYSPGGIAVRLFLSCWLVYALHFSTNIVREIFPALALGDHFSFRVDEYANMHPDLFEKSGYGWHIGNNPGVSMLAAIPYALARPLIDPLVAHVNQSRAAQGLTEPPAYNSPWVHNRQFYAEAWRRGYDIKFGLAALVMQTLAMAPSSAWGIVLMFFLLRILFKSDRLALGLALLYAFGTPVFFRTGFLNHNLMLGHIAFAGFIVMWNVGENQRWSSQTRFLLGGLAGGTALLFDYSGVVLLGGLGLYGFVKRWRMVTWSDAIVHSIWYGVGALGPVLLLWLYQWRSFGNPFLPGQHWMPPVQWSDLGYQGYGGPQLDLLLMLAFDYRFGLFVTMPLALLALLAPVFNRGREQRLPTFEMNFLLILFVAFWLFFSGSNYTRLQFNTGIRYLAPMFPFLFVLAAVTLTYLPRLLIFGVSVLSLLISWPLAMYRDVESGLGVLNPILHTLFGGFQLPALETLSLIDLKPYGLDFVGKISAVPLLLLAAVILYGIWSPFWSSTTPLILINNTQERDDKATSTGRPRRASATG